MILSIWRRVLFTKIIPVVAPSMSIDQKSLSNQWDVLNHAIYCSGKKNTFFFSSFSRRRKPIDFQSFIHQIKRGQNKIELSSYVINIPIFVISTRTRLETSNYLKGRTNDKKNPFLIFSLESHAYGFSCNKPKGKRNVRIRFLSSQCRKHGSSWLLLSFFLASNHTDNLSAFISTPHFFMSQPIHTLLI